MTEPTPPKKRRVSARGSKQKGDEYERDLAAYLNTNLYPEANPPRIYRTPLSGSFSLIKGVGSADLTGTPGLWVEAKRTETMKPHEFMAQARRGTIANNSADMPVVISRRNKQSLEDSLVIMNLKDFLPLYRAFLITQGFLRPRDSVEQPDPNQPQLPFG